MKSDISAAGGPPRVLIVSDHASVNFGGEAILPWHYFRLLRRRGVEAWLIVHDRTRDELIGMLPSEADRLHFTPDGRFHVFAARTSLYLPSRIWNMTFGYASRVVSQRSARALAKKLVKEYGVDVVHQPTPVSPRETSLMYGLGVPVVMGPMNGNMSYPPAFAQRRGDLVTAVSRKLSNLLHWIMPGKLRADVLLVANPRTRSGLPSGTRGEIVELVENGVDLDLWTAPAERPRREGPVRFVFLGRLVDWKAVDILLDALARVPAGPGGRPAPVLEILGDGPMRPALEDLARRSGLSDRVHFLGWRPQAELARKLHEADALVLSSLYECGGAVVLEAMASGLPVVATDWGGPSDYLDASCGFLVAPSSREAMVSGFADAMTSLAADPDLRERLGRAGRRRVESHFDWEAKVGEVIAIYRRAIDRRGGRSPRA